MGKHTGHTSDIRFIPRVCPLSHLSRDWPVHALSLGQCTVQLPVSLRYSNRPVRLLSSAATQSITPSMLRGRHAETDRTIMHANSPLGVARLFTVYA